MSARRISHDEPRGYQKATCAEPIDTPSDPFDYLCKQAGRYILMLEELVDYVDSPMDKTKILQILIELTPLRAGSHPRRSPRRHPRRCSEKTDKLVRKPLIGPQHQHLADIPGSRDESGKFACVLCDEKFRLG